MGNKVNPIILRLGYSKVWSKSFFVINRDYGKLMYDFMLLKAFLIYFIDRTDFYKLDLYYSHIYMSLLQNKVRVHLYLYEVYTEVTSLRDNMVKTFLRSQSRLRNYIHAKDTNLKHVWSNVNAYFLQTHFFLSLQEELFLKKKPSYSLGQAITSLNDTNIWKFLKSNKLMNFFLIKEYIKFLKQRKNVLQNKYTNLFNNYKIKVFSDESEFGHKLKKKLRGVWNNKDYVLRHPMLKFVKRHLNVNSFDKIGSNVYNTGNLDNHVWAKMHNIEVLQHINNRYVNKRKSYYKAWKKKNLITKGMSNKHKGLMFFYFDEFVKYPEIQSEHMDWLNLFLEKNKWTKIDALRFYNNNLDFFFWNDEWVILNLQNQIGFFTGEILFNQNKIDWKKSIEKFKEYGYVQAQWGFKEYLFNLFKYKFIKNSLAYNIRNMKYNLQNNLLLLVSRERLSFMNIKKYSNDRLRNTGKLNKIQYSLQRALRIFWYNKKLNLHSKQFIWQSNVVKLKKYIKGLRSALKDSVYRYYMTKELVNLNDILEKYKNIKNYLVSDGFETFYLSKGFLRNYFYNKVQNGILNNAIQLRRGNIMRFYHGHRLFKLLWSNVGYTLKNKLFGVLYQGKDFVNLYNKFVFKLRERVQDFTYINHVENKKIKKRRKNKNKTLKHVLKRQLFQRYNWKKRSNVIHKMYVKKVKKFLKVVKKVSVFNKKTRNPFLEVYANFINKEVETFKGKVSMMILQDYLNWKYNIKKYNRREKANKIRDWMQVEKHGLLEKVLETVESEEFTSNEKILRLYNRSNDFAEDFLFDIFNLDKEIKFPVNGLKFNLAKSSYSRALFNWFDRGKWNNRDLLISKGRNLKFNIDDPRKLQFNKYYAYGKNK